MKNLLILLAIAAAMTFSSAAMAKKADTAGLKGKITKIDGTKITVTGKGGTETVVVTDDTTKVTVDGKDATVADLKVGERVVVSPDTGTAAQITAMTKKGKKDPTTAPAN